MVRAIYLLRVKFIASAGIFLCSTDICSANSIPEILQFAEKFTNDEKKNEQKKLFIDSNNQYNELIKAIRDKDEQLSKKQQELLTQKKVIVNLKKSLSKEKVTNEKSIHLVKNNENIDAGYSTISLLSLLSYDANKFDRSSMKINANENSFFNGSNENLRLLINERNEIGQRLSKIEADDFNQARHLIYKLQMLLNRKVKMLKFDEEKINSPEENTTRGEGRFQDSTNVAIAEIGKISDEQQKKVELQSVEILDLKQKFEVVNSLKIKKELQYNEMKRLYEDAKNDLFEMNKKNEVSLNEKELEITRQKEFNLRLELENKELTKKLEIYIENGKNVINKDEIAKSENITDSNIKNLLERPDVRQAYATGTSLGNDIIRFVERRIAIGMNVNRSALLSGVIDTFNGKHLLDDSELKKAALESEEALKKAIEKSKLIENEKSKAYLEKLMKEKNVRKSNFGFWFVIDKSGDHPLSEGTIVDVVVKESLTDGTVINDMDINGKKLSQPIESFPPLFREALNYLNDNGEMTLIVPPEHAYGDAGYPPKIPPNSTVIYNIIVRSSINHEDSTVTKNND